MKPTINVLAVAGCSPRVEKLESGKYLPRLTVIFDEEPNLDIPLGEPCELEDEAIVRAASCALGLMFRVSGSA